MLPNIVEILSKMTPKSVQKGSKIAPGEAKIAPGGAPEEVPRTRSQKRPFTGGNTTPNGSKMASKIAALVDFGVIFDVF